MVPRDDGRHNAQRLSVVYERWVSQAGIYGWVSDLQCLEFWPNSLFPRVSAQLSRQVNPGAAYFWRSCAEGHVRCTLTNTLKDRPCTASKEDGDGVQHAAAVVAIGVWEVVVVAHGGGGVSWSSLDGKRASRTPNLLAGWKVYLLDITPSSSFGL